MLRDNHPMITPLCDFRQLARSAEISADNLTETGEVDECRCIITILPGRDCVGSHDDQTAAQRVRGGRTPKAGVWMKS